MDFYLDALEESFRYGQPEIFNSDQSSQFTSNAFTEVLTGREISISMDGRGRALDNVFIEQVERIIEIFNMFSKKMQI